MQARECTIALFLQPSQYSLIKAPKKQHIPGKKTKDETQIALLKVRCDICVSAFSGHVEKTHLPCFDQHQVEETLDQ